MAGQFHDAALLQFFLRLFTDTSQYVPIVDAPSVVHPLWALVAGLLLAGTVMRHVDADRACLSVLTAAVLISPIGWILSAWWFIGPSLALGLSSRGVRRMVIMWALGLLLWLPDSAPLWGQPSAWLTATWGSLNTWVVMALWAVATVPPSVAAKISGARLALAVRPMRRHAAGSRRR
jgi:hypothetical protein